MFLFFNDLNIEYNSNKFEFFCKSRNYSSFTKRIDGVRMSVFVSSAVGRGFDLRSMSYSSKGQEHRLSTDNVSEWSDRSTHGLLVL